MLLLTSEGKVGQNQSRRSLEVKIRRSKVGAVTTDEYCNVSSSFARACERPVLKVRSGNL